MKNSFINSLLVVGLFSSTTLFAQVSSEPPAYSCVSIPTTIPSTTPTTHLVGTLEDPVPELPGPIKLWHCYLSTHRNNRAIAFASPLMSGSITGPEDWKAIFVPPYCTVEEIPENDDPTSNLPHAMTTGDLECNYSVYYVTSYTLNECEDGTASIGRSGEGINLTSKTTGDIFGWAEATACESTTGTGETLNKDRPINFKTVTKQFY